MRTKRAVCVARIAICSLVFDTTVRSADAVATERPATADSDLPQPFDANAAKQLLQ